MCVSHTLTRAHGPCDTAKLVRFFSASCQGHNNSTIITRSKFRICVFCDMELQPNCVLTRHQPACYCLQVVVAAAEPAVRCVLSGACAAHSTRGCRALSGWPAWVYEQAVNDVRTVRGASNRLIVAMPFTAQQDQGPAGQSSPMHDPHAAGSAATPNSDPDVQTSVTVHLQAQVSLESGETADEITSSGPLDKSLSATATSLQERYVAPGGILCTLLHASSAVPALCARRGCSRAHVTSLCVLLQLPPVLVVHIHQ